MTELVKPSGDIHTAPVGLRWNYPSYTTGHRENGSVCDETNPGINMIVKKSFVTKILSCTKTTIVERSEADVIFDLLVSAIFTRISRTT
jgi:hypothetical protein